MKDLTTATRDAHLYRVDTDMATLIEHAADSLDADDLGDQDLLPSDDGLVHFERPITVRGIEGRNHKIHWLVWRTIIDRHDDPDHTELPGVPRHGLVLMWLFNDAVRDPDETTLHHADQVVDYARRTHDSSLITQQKVLSALGQFATISAEIYLSGKAVGQEYDPETLEDLPSLVVGADSTTTLDAEGSRQLLADPNTMALTLSVPAQNLVRIAHAMFLLMNQSSVCDVQSEPVRKHHRLLAERRTGKPPTVTAIRLRRNPQANPQHGESTRQWQARWVVRGHWRWQAYGPRWSERRRQWVAPHIKGPDDKALKITKHVYDVRT